MPAIIPHRHCPVCGKAIEPDKTFCSKECEIEMNRMQKRQRNYMIFLFVLFLIFFTLLVFTSVR